MCLRLHSELISYMTLLFLLSSHLPRSSSEPLGLNKSNLMSSLSTTFGGRDDWQGSSKGLGLRLRKRSSRPSSPSCPVSVSCLADKHANVDKVLRT